MIYLLMQVSIYYIWCQIWYVLAYWHQKSKKSGEKMHRFVVILKKFRNGYIFRGVINSRDINDIRIET